MTTTSSPSLFTANFVLRTCNDTVGTIRTIRQILGVRIGISLAKRVVEAAYTHVGVGVPVLLNDFQVLAIQEHNPVAFTLTNVTSAKADDLAINLARIAQQTPAIMATVEAIDGASFIPRGKFGQMVGLLGTEFYDSLALLLPAEVDLPRKVLLNFHQFGYATFYHETHGLHLVDVQRAPTETDELIDLAHAGIPA